MQKYIVQFTTSVSVEAHSIERAREIVEDTIKDVSGILSSSNWVGDPYSEQRGIMKQIMKGAYRFVVEEN